MLAPAVPPRPPGPSRSHAKVEAPKLDPSIRLAVVLFALGLFAGARAGDGATLFDLTQVPIALSPRGPGGQPPWELRLMRDRALNAGAAQSPR